MTRYYLLLKARTENKTEELELKVKKASRVPVEDETIDLTNSPINDYLEAMQNEKGYPYLSVFGNAKYNVTKIDHHALPLNKNIETMTRVTALKI